MVMEAEVSKGCVMVNAESSDLLKPEPGGMLDMLDHSG